MAFARLLKEQQPQVSEEVQRHALFLNSLRLPVLAPARLQQAGLSNIYHPTRNAGIRGNIFYLKMNAKQIAQALYTELQSVRMFIDALALLNYVAKMQRSYYLYIINNVYIGASLKKYLWGNS
ncbi:hypothetical protein LWM68_25355 [Niabella sp. W65]|nr:hypothetical protein [Niabella sp. W65]MCH7365796.1 hypothetical protein [Niabella sp. W65]